LTSFIDTNIRACGDRRQTDRVDFLPKATMLTSLEKLIARHCASAQTQTAIPRLILTRSEAPTALSSAIYSPLLCVLASGTKRILLGRQEYRYDAEHYLIASADLPVRGQALTACSALTLMLDPAVVADVLLALPPTSAREAAPAALAVSPLDGELTDALARLVRTLDRPADIPVLAGLIEREIIYRLLLGPQGEMLRQLAAPTSHLSHIKRAIAVIRDRYDEKVRIDELARAAGMSVTSFHRHFRAATNMSPLQFQKRIRLHEARRMLLSSEADAAHVSLDVGYESASQFSREYRRLFGTPPARDAAQVRKRSAAAT